MKFSRLGRFVGATGQHVSEALRSPLFMEWLARLDPRITLHNVHFQSVDLVKREGEEPRVLFIKLKTDARENGERILPGIVLLRGDAVGALIVLKTEMGDLTILVEQTRLPHGGTLLEIPAGMQDGSPDALGTILREITEETGLDFSAQDVISLHDGSMLPSPGLVDERITLFACDKPMTKTEVAELDGKETGAVEEGERITLRIIPLEMLPKVTSDMKTLLAYSLYKARLSPQ